MAHNSQNPTMSSTGVTPQISNEVTVLVFKDNYAARTFRIPLKWISRFGFYLWALALLTLIVSFFAVKYYWIARNLDPSHVESLEREISDLKSSQKNDSTSQASAPAAAVAAPQPVPTVTVTVTPVAQSAPTTVSAPAKTIPGTKAILFSALPSSVQSLPNESASTPINIQNTKAVSHGKSLNVRFDIQYIKGDGQSQQGRIVVIARSASGLLSYPQGVFAPTGSDFLIAPKKGEYFSVSRFREVNANFSPIGTGGPFTEAEVLIFNQAEELLIYRKLPITMRAQAPTHSSSAGSAGSAQTTEDKSDIIENSESPANTPNPSASTSGNSANPSNSGKESPGKESNESTQ